MTGQEEQISKAEALKRAKAENKLDKMSNSVLHVLEGKTSENIVLSQADLPDLPTLHFKNCQSCIFTIPEGTKVVKILFESCTDSKLEFKGCIIATGICEAWRCDRCELLVDCAVGTLQIDVCNGFTVSYTKVAHMGMVVQAGVQKLVLRFSDGAVADYHTGLDELRSGQAGADAASLNDTTDQCITRFVDGRLLTERILRLANDYPTTAREKAAFDAEARRKAAAMEGLVKDMLKLGEGGAAVGGDEAERLRALAEAAGSSAAADDDCSDAARARHRRAQGNEAFKLGDYQQAAVFYTEALTLDDKDPALHSNRAACFLKLGQAVRALADAERCVALDPAAVKGHFRRGVALMALDRPEEAAAAMARTLDLDPRNAEARATLQLAQAKAARRRAAP
jgi:Flp pilus assembly protein TadD